MQCAVAARSITLYNRLSLHHFFRNLPADTVSLSILSLDINSSKSAIVRGELFKVTMHGIAASLAAFIPSGAFSTTIASEELFSKFSLCDATLNGSGSGFPFPSNSSPFIIKSNLSIWCKDRKYVLILFFCRLDYYHHYYYYRY